MFIGQGDGSAGYSIYRKGFAVCGGTVICAYSKYLNEYIGLFISCCSDMNQSKYSHGYSRNEKRLKRDYIMLPITDNGDPDYEYMEQYTKNLMFTKYNKYLNYLKKQKK